MLRKNWDRVFGNYCDQWTSWPERRRWRKTRWRECACTARSFASDQWSQRLSRRHPPWLFGLWLLLTRCGSEILVQTLNPNKFWENFRYLQFDGVWFRNFLTVKFQTQEIIELANSHLAICVVNSSNTNDTSFLLWSALKYFRMCGTVHRSYWSALQRKNMSDSSTLL